MTFAQAQQDGSEELAALMLGVALDEAKCGEETEPTEEPTEELEDEDELEDDMGDDLGFEDEDEDEDEDDYDDYEDDDSDSDEDDDDAVPAGLDSRFAPPAYRRG